ncbi:hypothetical protein [Peribacillus acanthi]|nr:hypothetical protein [Peribacillus acanthi]
MDKDKISKESDQNAESMNTVDEGLNLVSQIVNNATGLDKGNDGKASNQE